MLAIYCRTSIEKENDGVSTIKQQSKAGIEFAKKHNLEYKVYEDEGISGYKLEDDDNPFKGRKGFLDMIDDIKSKLVDKVWVWEQSRLSRNNISTAHIYSIFKKYSITLYQKDSEYNINDPNVKMIMTIMGAVAENEREAIVSRITRGHHEKINDGRRAHGKLYGYKSQGITSIKSGKYTKTSHIIKPVESEIEKLKMIFSEYLKGKSLTYIMLQLQGKTETDKLKYRTTETASRLLSHFDYTSYSLNMKGLEILHKFENLEIDNLSMLNDNQYYSKSKTYTEKIVSIENWIKIQERLILNRRASKALTETRNAHKTLATGLIKCGFCKNTYYPRDFKNIIKNKAGIEIQYVSKLYNHYNRISRLTCPQKPKTISWEKVDNIFKLFFFYFYLVFDNTHELIEKSQKDIKINIASLKEIVKTLEKELSSIRKQKQKFNDVIETEDIDTSTIISLEKRITNTEIREKEIQNILSNNIILLEKEKEKFSTNEKKNTYYNVKSKILSFLNGDIVTQRNEIRQVITESYVFNTYLLIIANKRLFLFSLKEKYNIEENTIENLVNDKVFMSNFIKEKDPLSKRHNAITTEKVLNVILEYDARKLKNNTLIHSLNLDKKDYRKNLSKVFKKNNIVYDLKDIEYFISFENTSMKPVWKKTKIGNITKAEKVLDKDEIFYQLKNF